MINKLNSFDLNLHWRFSNWKKYTFAFLSLFVCLIIIYGNSFHCDWQFDDSPNILENRDVHLKTLSWTDIKKAFHFTPVQGLPRPVAYLSFGLNYYSGGLDVFGYHVVNFTIHCLATAFLFLFIFNTLKLPLLRDKYGRIAYPVALLATFLWATNPLQVNAVTYIVQRMTSMAGMAYMMSMYFYLKGRTAVNERWGILFFLLSALSALLSFGSKENAAMLPVSLLFYDLFFLQGITRKNVIKNLIILTIPGLLLVTLGALYLKFSHMIFLNYSPWTFTLTERLLTEPRVIMYYISLLLYPVSSRLTMDHDIDISHSILDPWTTVIAVLLILFMIGYAVYTAKKRPLTSYCIIFFFLNHLIEGSFLALDLIFEHRNYLPSMLFFVPLAMLLLNVLDYFSYKKSLQFIMASVMTFILAAQAHTVSLRNDILRYDKILWEDNVSKMPLLSRPHGALGRALFDQGNYDEALLETQKAINLARYPNYAQPAIYLCNEGNYYLYIKNNAEKALDYYQQALKIQPHIPAAHYGVTQVMLEKGLWAYALNNIKYAIIYKPNNSPFHASLALTYLKMGELDKAIQTAEQAIALQENFALPLSIKAEAYRLKGKFNLSIFYLEKYVRLAPLDIGARVCLVELYAWKDDRRRLIQTIGMLLSHAGEKKIASMLEEMAQKKNLVYTPKKEIILPIIKSALLRNVIPHI